MFYPRDFKERVKKKFPYWEELHQLLDSGDVAVGKHLKDNCKTGISMDMILSATSLERLKDCARTAKEINDLYAEWEKLCNANNA